MVAQQGVEHSTGLKLNRADPLGSAGSGLYGPAQHLAQLVTDEPVAGLIVGKALSGHRCPTLVVCQAAAGTDGSRMLRVGVVVTVISCPA